MKTVKLAATEPLAMRSETPLRLVTFILGLIGALLVGVSYQEGHPGLVILGAILCFLGLLLYLRMDRDP